MKAESTNDEEMEHPSTKPLRHPTAQPSTQSVSQTDTLRAKPQRPERRHECDRGEGGKRQR